MGDSLASKWVGEQSRHCGPYSLSRSLVDRQPVQPWDANLTPSWQYRLGHDFFWGGSYMAPVFTGARGAIEVISLGLPFFEAMKFRVPKVILVQEGRTCRK